MLDKIATTIDERIGEMVEMGQFRRPGKLPIFTISPNSSAQVSCHASGGMVLRGVGFSIADHPLRFSGFPGLRRSIAIGFPEHGGDQIRISLSRREEGSYLLRPHF